MDKLKLLLSMAVIIAGVIGFYQLGDQSVLLRAGVVILAVLVAAGIALTSQRGQDAWGFAKDARTEVRKVVWPTRKETIQATLMVLGMVIVVGFFLWAVDSILFKFIYDIVLDARPA